MTFPVFKLNGESSGHALQQYRGHLTQISGKAKPEDSEKSAQIKLRAISHSLDPHNRQTLPASASDLRAATPAMSWVSSEAKQRCWQLQPVKPWAKHLSEGFLQIPEALDQTCQAAREDNTRPGDKVSDTKIKFRSGKRTPAGNPALRKVVHTYAGSHCETIKEITMLVLSRKKNETIIIDGRIKVEILKIKGNTIRLGITAPKEMKVLRGELSPFEVEIEVDDASDIQSVAREKPGYVQRSSGFPVSADEAAALPNPFAVIAG